MNFRKENGIGYGRKSIALAFFPVVAINPNLSTAAKVRIISKLAN
jgi:hypothetical protein